MTASLTRDDPVRVRAGIDKNHSAERPVVPQSTQGIPFLAVTAPPCAPLVGSGTAEAEEAGVPETSASVASAPSMTSTWPAVTVALAVAVTWSRAAILAALAEAPVPYVTWVVVSALVFWTSPARQPSLTSTVETRPASPALL